VNNMNYSRCLYPNPDNKQCFQKQKLQTTFEFQYFYIINISSCFSLFLQRFINFFQFRAFVFSRKQ